MKPQHYQQTLELFVECNHIRDLSNRLLEEADIIEGHAMNAAIAAGHTGGQIKTFSEIARLIRECAQKLSVKVKHMKVEVNIVVNKTLINMIKSNQMTIFQTCLPRISSVPNRKTIESIISNYQDEIEKSRHEIRTNIEGINEIIMANNNIYNRIWAVITRLRIEASTMDPDDQVFILNIADEVGRSIEETKNILTSLTLIIQSSKNIEETTHAS